jgi:hypothetical protein
MSEEIKQDCRRFLHTVATTIGAAQFGLHAAFRSLR